MQGTAERGDGFDRIAVGLYDQRIGKHRQQALHLRHVPRVLQEPAPVGFVGADQTQHVGVTTIRGLLVLRKEPAVVRRDVGRGAEAIADEALAQHIQTLLDFVGDHVMRPAHWADLEIRLERGHRGLIGRLRGPARARRPNHRCLGQPVFETLKLWIHRQQLVQRGRSGARNAGDDQRCANRIAQAFGPLAPATFGTQRAARVATMPPMAN